ncbi:MAG: sigma 54-interacting transcriptional regulator, partial [Daejeonella sp.]
HRIAQLEQKINKKYSFDTILGSSQLIKQAISLARKVSDTDATVLLLGETGTGKEVFAQAIHQESHRKQKEFVVVNCSAFSKELLESELFGHKAGAFTGAIKEKKGLFEEANNGTLFLDEIGEMNIDLQAKLLRVLENGEFIKVGDTKTTKVNVRIIAATNKNLNEEIEKGNFRSDLFYRLSVFNINLPSLSQRKEDIPIFAKHYLKEFSYKTNRQITGMDDPFLKRLVEHTWKGNVRELKNLMERAVILSESKILTTDLLPIEFYTNSDDGTISLNLASVEKKHIIYVLHYAKGNKTEAARILNIGLTTLYRKIEEYHLS